MRKHKRCSCRNGGKCCCGGCGGGSNSLMLIVTIGITVGFLMAYAVRRLLDEELI